MTRLVDLTSDTKTRPGPAMRRAMAGAEVGDEQYGEDPTVEALCRRTAELVGKEAAVFLPSGTMANQIAVRLHCRPGEALVCERSAHIHVAEAGGAAAISGVTTLTLDGRDGVFAAADLRSVLRPPSRHVPRPALVVVEQTSNFGGGTPWPQDDIGEVADTAREAGLAVHIDGARLFNASVATGTPAERFCRHADTVYVDFTKGLGAPFGSVLAGSAQAIAEAWRWKQMLGGAMRQAGIVAAGALYALDNNVARLADDHENARVLAVGLETIPGIAVTPRRFSTNIVLFEVVGRPRDAFLGALRERGVLFGRVGAGGVRALTHLDVGRADIEAALAAVKDVMEG